MPDVVVTLPKSFGLRTWIEEGDPAGVEWSGQEWHFYSGGSIPLIQPSERVYCVYDGRLIGFAPLVRVERADGYRSRRFAFVRHGGAEAVTIDEPIRGFRGWRYRWWRREIERPYPGWHRGILREARHG